MVTPRPLLLDLYCGAGLAAKGYADAGFEVVGVDINPQPSYPYRFVQDDALNYLRWRMGAVQRHVSVVHGSPPCQRYSRSRVIRGNSHPDLVGPTREVLERTGLPWVMENVEGAPLRPDLVLCGAMFGLRTYRHRLFEFGGGMKGPPPPEHPAHVARTAEMGRPVKDGEFITAVGNFSGVELVRRDWGVPWANRDGLREGIPPAYTRFIGEHMMKELVK